MKRVLGQVAATVAILVAVGWTGIACSGARAAEQDTTLVDSTEEVVALNDSGIVRLLFAGDMMQHDGQIKAAYDTATKGYDYSSYFRYLSPISLDADLAICNLEVTLGGAPYKGYPQFSAPDEYAQEIMDAGYDIFLTANNHCLDRGKKGLERTIDWLKDKDIPQIGTYKDSLDRAKRYPALTEYNGVKFVLLNYTYGTNGLKVKGGNIVNYIDKAVIKKDIAKAKALEPDYIIACMHWGIEYVTTPNKEQKDMAKWLINQGVDHVIGGHPHVVQPVEIIETKDGRKHFVIYSQGNVISNMRKKNTDFGVLVGLTLQAKGDSADYNVTAETAWYTAYHVGRPDNTKLKNFVAYPSGLDEAVLPGDEAERLAEAVKDCQAIMATGDSITEKTSRNWGW
ncbi:MAG: CapA family protein [Bacteroidales bacterium]|nr:CapA family protein [Bacteroidales bacterium]